MRPVMLAPPLCLALSLVAHASELVVTVNGIDPEFDAAYYTIENCSLVDVLSVRIDVSFEAGAYFDFDGLENFAGASDPVINSVTGLNAADVTWTYDASYPHPLVMTATFSPPLAPGAAFDFGADVDSLVDLGGAWGGTDAYITGSYVTGEICLTTFNTETSGLSTAGCNPGEVGDNYCQALSNSTGSAALVSATGTLNNLTLSAAPVPNTLGMFIHHPDQVQLPFGNGTQCVGSPFVRLGVVAASANTAQATVDLTMAVPVRVQYWFRDPAAGGAAFNLSDGIRIP